MNELSIFNYEEREVRTVTIDGEPWFVAKDVCDALGYRWNGSTRIEHVPEEWRRVTSVVTLRGDEQDMAIMSEQGLYFFLGRSNKPAALPMQKWIAGDVLPTIRKTGLYGVKVEIPTHAEALRLAADMVEKNQTLQLQIEADRPKVELASAIVASSKSIGITEYCKSISKIEGFIIGRNNFYAWLRAEKMLNHKNLPYQEYLDKGYFEVQEGVYESVGNGPVPFFKTVITGHGQERLLARIRQSSTFAKYLNNYSKAGVIRSAMMASVQ